MSAAVREITVVDSRARFAPGALLQVFRYRELIYALTQREIKARYRQSLLGIGWAIAQPLALMVVFTLVFSGLLGVSSDGIPYPIFAYVALVPWTFFSNALTTATIGLVSQRSVVTKTYFPREVIVLSQVGARFVDFLAAALILVAMMIGYGIQPTLWLLLAPVLLLVLLMLVVGVSLISSAMHVSFRDLAPVVGLGLQVWLYVTPVKYPLSVALEKMPAVFRPFYVLNPMVGLIDGFRSVVALGQPPAWDLLAVSAAVSFAVLLVGYAYFKYAELAFADVI